MKAGVLAEEGCTDAGSIADDSPRAESPAKRITLWRADATVIHNQVYEWNQDGDSDISTCGRHKDRTLHLSSSEIDS